MLLGLVVLASWGFDLRLLETLWPGRPRMVSNSALMLLLSGAGLWLLLPNAPTRSGLRYRTGQGLGIVVAALGLATLAEYLFGIELGMDELLFGDASAAALNAIPGRPAFPTALSGMGIGLSLALLDVRFSRVWLAEIFAVTTMQVALLGAIGHIFNTPELYGVLPSKPGTGMAVHSALGFLLLSGGLLCARPDRGIMAVLRSHTPGGTLARRWMPVPALVLLLLGIVYLLMEQTPGMYRTIGSWSLFMTSLIVLSAAIWTTVAVLHRAGLERDNAHRLLEQRVQERTAELNRANQALNAASDELAQANQRLEKTVEERTAHLRDTLQSLQIVCYNIAHDLRAPNRAIAGFAEALVAAHAKELDETARDYLHRIAAAAQRSDALTMDLLEYGRLAHADLPCSRQCLKSHVESVMDKLAADIDLKRASVAISEALPDLWANSAALDQVLTNLLSNALKFVADGVPPQVSIRAENAGPNCRVLVQDNGIGIPFEYQQKIFGVFQRLHPPEKYPGTGIGLAIVHKSLERMGGRVGVSSSTGNGSCFWFELPRADNGPEDI